MLPPCTHTLIPVRAGDIVKTTAAAPGSRTTGGSNGSAKAYTGSTIHVEGVAYSGGCVSARLQCTHTCKCKCKRKRASARDIGRARVPSFNRECARTAMPQEGMGYNAAQHNGA